MAGGVRALTFGAVLVGAALLAGCTAPAHVPSPRVTSADDATVTSADDARVTTADDATVPTADDAGATPTPLAHLAVPLDAMVPPVVPPGGTRPAPPARITEITPGLAARMATSWHDGCPVALADLRYVRVPYVDPDGASHTGELVVHADAAADIAEVFRQLWSIGYPITSMRLVDDFDGDDTASMNADNTSAFNCRPITGGTSWSEHAYGLALDLNPVENPYVVGSHVAPRAGRAFVGRPDAPGVLHADDAVVAAFARIGWVWGGTWDGRVLDYQHFSLRGR